MLKNLPATFRTFTSGTDGSFAPIIHELVTKGIRIHTNPPIGF